MMYVLFLPFNASTDFLQISIFISFFKNLKLEAESDHLDKLVSKHV